VKKNKNKKPEKPVYYHGGFPGLSPGDELHAFDKTSISLRQNYPLFDPKLIFVTTSLDLATAYALLFARTAPVLPNYSGPAKGSVYRVDVKGPKTPDEDFAEHAPSRGGHFSYAVTVSPRITAVVDTVAADPHREYRLFAPFETWASPDGEVYPIWSPEGYMLPNPTDAKNGLTWEMLEEHFKMGPFPGKDKLIQNGFYDPT
jgi:hypothetical protein